MSYFISINEYFFFTDGLVSYNAPVGEQMPALPAYFNDSVYDGAVIHRCVCVCVCVCACIALILCGCFLPPSPCCGPVAMGTKVTVAYRVAQYLTGTAESSLRS